MDGQDAVDQSNALVGSVVRIQQRHKSCRHVVTADAEPLDAPIMTPGQVLDGCLALWLC